MLQAVGAKVVLPFTKDSFHQLLQRQLDFKWEAYNLCRFARNFAIEQQKSKDTVRFPRVSPKLLSDTVLVETWAEGRTVSVLYQESRGSADDRGKTEIREKMAQSIFDMVLKMFLRDNFVHGDMHAGNLLYEKTTNEMTVIDAGMITSLGPQVGCVGCLGLFSSPLLPLLSR